MSDLMRPENLRKIASDAEALEATKNLEFAKSEEEEQKKLLETFMGREIHPDVRERVNSAVRRAAELGRHEIEVIVFPARYCNDGGRRINNNEEDWPDSLEGFAKRAYEYFDKELRPLDYKIRTQILDYPNDMPGNVGLYLSW